MVSNFRVFVPFIMVLFILLPIVCLADSIQGESEELDADHTVGRVVECSVDKSFIQVNNRGYTVNQVKIIDDEGKLLPASRTDIRENDIVRIIPDEKSSGAFLAAEQVIIYRGKLRDDIASQLDISLVPLSGGGAENTNSQSMNNSSPSINRSGNGEMVFENGVWHN